MTKTSLKSSTIAELPLYSAWSRADRNGEIVTFENDPDDEVKVGKYLLSELREIGIDPEYFGALPEDDQKYVVEEERRKNKHRRILHKPADNSRIKGKNRRPGESRMNSMSPSKGSRGGSLPLTSRIALPKPYKPALFNKTALPDVLDIVTKWIDSRGNAGPAERDAGKVKAYLRKCLAAEAGLAGVETVVVVMKTMRGIIGEKWDEEVGISSGVAGGLWWETWRSMKREMDELSLRTFGAPLKL